MNDNDFISHIYQEERPWGFFRKFTHNAPSTIKIISVKPQAELSLQSHKHRAEFWRVISGSGFFTIDQKVIAVSKGDEHYTPVGTKHKIAAGPEGLEVLEIALGDFDEVDITRFEDKYGRV